MLEAYIIGALGTAMTLGVSDPDPDDAQAAFTLLYAILWPLFWARLAGTLIANVTLAIWEKIND